MEDLEVIDLDIVDLDKEKTEEKEYSLKREIISTVLYLLAVVALTFLFVQFVGQRTHVNGDSMNVTLEDGDNLIVDKLSYRFTDPERFDIIVFPYKYQEKTYYIKRIIGMPGETVQIIDGMVYIDGEMLDETYGKEVMQYSGVASDPITLGEDEYFVLGDNRNNSSDSRDPSVGNIQKDQIIGKAFIRIWPLNKFGILKHQ
ncbi:MAG: signal peptidase I [Lachnospiraceae bacterium]|nr:signal peptidase I [Lachnospiraceae bacterium]